MTRKFDIRKILLLTEYLLCFGLLLSIYALGLFATLVGAVVFPFSGELPDVPMLLDAAMLLAVMAPATLGLMGATSMMMEILSGEEQLPRRLQIVFTLIGIALAFLILGWAIDSGAQPVGALVLIAPILCAIHFLFLTNRYPARAAGGE